MKMGRHDENHRLRPIGSFYRQLLRDRRFVRRRSHRTAIRRHNPHRRTSHWRRRGPGIERICDAHCASFRSRAAAFRTYKRPLEGHRHGRSSLGGTGPLRSCVRGHRIYRMRKQDAYAPEFEDWLFHFVLPLVAYAALVGSSALAHANARGSLFAVGSSALLLLFVGIHNAWDAVTYHVFSLSPRKSKQESRPESD